MKKLIFINIVILAILGGCTQDDIPTKGQDGEISNMDNINIGSHKIPIEKAITLAESCIGKTRSPKETEISYLFSKKDTRSVPDTLAYIFNYEDNGGFDFL